MAKYLILLFSLCSLSIFAQKQDLVKYLKACKTTDLEASQNVIASYSFGKKPDFTIEKDAKFSGMAFDTDIPTVKGYKATGICKIKNKDGSFSDKNLMVVMYFDKIKEHWSVFSLRQLAEPKNEYEIAKADVEAGKFYTAKEFVYRNLAYWSLMAGQITEAKKYIELGIAVAKSTTNDHSFTTNQIDVVLKCIM